MIVQLERKSACKCLSAVHRIRRVFTINKLHSAAGEKSTLRYYKLIDPRKYLSLLSNCSAGIDGRYVRHKLKVRKLRRNSVVIEQPFYICD